MEAGTVAAVSICESSDECMTHLGSLVGRST